MERAQYCGLLLERGWRDMKQIIGLRPVCHRREERIRAHVILCWLALLLIRIIETQSGITWTRARRTLQLHAGPSPAPPARSSRSPASLGGVRWARLGIPHPKPVLDLQSALR